MCITTYYEHINIALVITCIHNSCNTGMSASPDMCVQTLGHACSTSMASLCLYRHLLHFSNNSTENLINAFFYTGLYCGFEYNDQNVLMMQCFNKLCTTIKCLGFVI